MTIGSQEHYDMLEQFESVYKGQFRLDREPKEIWRLGHFYQDGHANSAFRAFSKGYAFARCKYLQGVTQ